MNLIHLIARSASPDFTAEEAVDLDKELQAAYHADELAATSPEIGRIAEMVRCRLEGAPGDPPQVEG
ncbi:hypothetical protein OKA04_18360 [Luteolibacter flavescens]|uniref:Uncharacterized protein n=1 Tax=Luteolibacter flavescens TaxID=1859460 RepID=A0ABT3FT02_9BACT|nr:hypothetical protein [Luteolibacter flavescens]MCW1886708.1 hypothetical protein [Luteolibacter flavescens]